MWAATAAWEGAANVRFVYDPSQDGACFTNATIIHVWPWSSGGAQSFYPSTAQAGDFPGALTINYTEIDTADIWKGITTTAVLTHELGHIISFRHEHIRPEAHADCCLSGDSDPWRSLTVYDNASVIALPWSLYNGVPSTWAKAFALTDLDRQGAASIYGPGATPAGTNAIDRSEFFVRQVYRDVLKREPDAGGAAFYAAILQGCNGASSCLASTRASIVRDIMESTENRQQDPDLNPASPNCNAAFLTHCYTNLLRRQPDADWYSQYLNALNAYGDYNGLVGSFINSAEYRMRFGVQ